MKFRLWPIFCIEYNESRQKPERGREAWKMALGRKRQPAGLLLLDPVAAHETPRLWSADQQRQIAAELSYMQGHYLQAYHQLEGVREEEPGALSALTLRAAALVSSGDAAPFARPGTA